MTREEEIINQIKELESKKKPLELELRELYKKSEEEIKAKIVRCTQLKDRFNADELIFAAYNRCACGAGMAYPKGIGIHGHWDCSAILLGEADVRVQHTGQLPFVFYEIKSEEQPSANGSTTRKPLEK